MALAFVQEAKGTASGSYQDPSPPPHLGLLRQGIQTLGAFVSSLKMRNVDITSWDCRETKYCDLDQVLSTM